jgi:DNA-binding CsgD family transcriptional regulator
MSLYTPRELEILHLVADLHTRDEIQAILGCHKSTVDFHLGKLYEKAECHSYLHLIRYALDQGHGCRYQVCLDTCPIEAAIAKRKAHKTSKPKLIVERVYLHRQSKHLVVERKTIDE